MLFRPLLLPHIVNGKPGGIMRATIGKEVTIKVNLKTQNVTQVLYGK